MTKRHTFYIRADLFETKVSPRAKLILAYLSRVSNRQGQSCPAVPTIAEKCGCCPNSARKALRELAPAGFIAITARDLPTRRGNRVYMANIYTLLFLPSRNEGGPLHDLKGGTARDAGQRYDRDLTIDVPYGHSQSVYDETDHDHDPDLSQDGLDAVLDRIHLELFRDEPCSFAKCIRHAVRRMYHAESIRVNGRTIPRDDVRSALDLLTIDHIDFVARQLREATSCVTWGEGYLISCPYNAPLDCMTKSRCG